MSNKTFFILQYVQNAQIASEMQPTVDNKPVQNVDKTGNDTADVVGQKPPVQVLNVYSRAGSGMRV